MVFPSARSLPILMTTAILAWGLLPAGDTAGMPTRIREALRTNLLSRADIERMERGYYEQILDAGRQLGSSPTAAPARTGIPALVYEGVADVREVVLRPGLSIMLPTGVRWSTNDRGMRDRAYASAKPPATLRIAMLGDSIGAGWGVGDGVGFEPTLERRLDDRSRGAAGPAVEILNFAVPGRSPGQRWEHFLRIGAEMRPDLVLFEATQADVGWDERRLRELLPRGIGWDAPFYRETLARSGAKPGGAPGSYAAYVRPYRWEFAAEVYRAVASGCHARGIPCLWVAIPRVGRTVDAADHERLVALARSAGFDAVIDVTDAFDGVDPATLAVRPDDYHPNAIGHRLLADRIDRALRDQPDCRRILQAAASKAARGAG